MAMARRTGECWFHRRPATPGRSMCGECLIRTRVRSRFRRGIRARLRECLRCNRRWWSRGTRFCQFCRRTLRRNPEAEVRKVFGEGRDKLYKRT